MARAVRELAARHGVRPKKSLGQHFLVDPNLARSIVRWAGVGPGDRILEVGAGLGSLTVALARAGGRVVAVEVDRAAVAALSEVVDGIDGVEVLAGDASRLNWAEVVDDEPWKMVSNLPYNIAVPVVMELLERAPQVRELTVMVQREVGERMVAGPGQDQYGGVSVRVAYHAEGRMIRRVPPSVFWPEPKVESVIVRLVRRPPPVDTSPERLFPVVAEGFAQRRKTMRNALVRLGLERAAAGAVLAGCGLAPNVRAEQLGLREFACLADAIHG